MHIAAEICPRRRRVDPVESWTALQVELARAPLALGLLSQLRVPLLLGIRTSDCERWFECCDSSCNEVRGAPCTTARCAGLRLQSSPARGLPRPSTEKRTPRTQVRD